MLRTVDVASGASMLYHVATPPDQIQDRNEAGPVWSPDGKWMAFIMNATLHIVPVDPNGVPTGSPMQLTDHAADMPSWSGASSTILYVSNGKLKTIQVDGTGQKTTSVRPDMETSRASGVARSSMQGPYGTGSTPPFTRTWIS